MKEESKIVELLAEMLRKADKNDELLARQGVELKNQGVELKKQGVELEKHGDLLEMQGRLLERHGLLLEKLVEGQLDLISGQNQTNAALRDIKIAIDNIAGLDERVKKLEMVVFKQAS